MKHHHHNHTHDDRMGASPHVHMIADFKKRFYISSILSIPGGWPFLKGLKGELSAGGTGMMTLIAIAISVAWAYSTAVVFGLEGKVFY